MASSDSSSEEKGSDVVPSMLKYLVVQEYVF